MTKKVVALILAGGRGKRMDILCSLRPKPAIPFAGRYKIIDFTLSNCANSKINDIAGLVDYRRVEMAEYLEKWHEANSNTCAISILEPINNSYLGTADAVYKNLNYIENQHANAVLILAGDHVYEMDYRAMLRFHEKMRADVTVGVIRVPIEEAHRFGTVSVDSEGRIKKFVEKSSRPDSNLASMGIYIFNRDILTKHLVKDANEPDSLHDFGYSILPRMIKTDRVFAHEFGGYWRDIGTIEAYYDANMDFLREQPPVNFEGNWPIFADGRETSFENNSHLNINNSLISPGCFIKGRVENSILSPGVTVEKNAFVRDSIIMGNTFIDEYSVVEQCILDENIYIGKYCRIGFGESSIPKNSKITLIGKDVIVASHTTLNQKSKILPGSRISDYVSDLVTSVDVFEPRT